MVNIIEDVNAVVQIKGSVRDFVWNPDNSIKGQKTYRPKCRDYHNKDEVTSLNILSNNSLNPRLFLYIDRCILPYDTHIYIYIYIYIW